MSGNNYFDLSDEDLEELICKRGATTGTDSPQAAARAVLMKRMTDKTVKVIEKNGELIDNAIEKLNENEKSISSIMKENNQLGKYMKLTAVVIALAAVANFAISLLVFFRR